MKDYSEFPPFKYFVRVLKSCPKSAFLYAQIWKNTESSLSLVAKKKEIRKDYLISPTLFRSLLAPLMFLNVLYFKENEEKFQIDFFGQDGNE